MAVPIQHSTGASQHCWTRLGMVGCKGRRSSSFALTHMAHNLSIGSLLSLQMEAELYELKDFRKMRHIPVLSIYFWKEELAMRLVMLAGKSNLSYQTGQSLR